MIQDNRLWLLISRHLSGEASPGEVEELQGLIEQSPDKQYLLDILHGYFVTSSAEVANPKISDRDLEQKFNKIVKKECEKLPLSEAEAEQTSAEREGRLIYLPVRKIIYYAAAVIGMVFLVWNVFRNRLHNDLPANLQPSGAGEVVARPGVRTKLVLPDGTQVWLNSNSKLKYAKDFNTRSREVELEGEAYFDVAKDMEHPFIVHASAIDVKVLGTAFTIKSYLQDETIEATLLRGAIEISRPDNPNTPRVILKPNEKLVFNKHLASLPVRSTDRIDAHPVPATPDISVNAIPGNIPDSDKVETAWLYNKLVFNGDSFKELAQKMERWYNVKISFEDKTLYKYRFGGVFANESIQDALNPLQLTPEFNYKIRGNEIELYGK